MLTKKANVYHKRKDYFKVPLGNEVWVAGLLSLTSEKELSYINFMPVNILMK